MILYQHSMSVPSRFVRLSLAEYDVDVELREERLWERRAEFLAINPAATLPVLMAESGLPVIGAFAISEYLDETRGTMMRNRRLMPEYPLDRAEVRRLVDWFVVKIDTDVVRSLVRERVFKLEMPADRGGGAPDSNAMRAARTNARQHLKYLNWLAGSRNWLAGKNVSLADIAAGGSVSILDYMGEVDWSEWPHARDWYQRVKSRPSFRGILSERIRAMAPSSHYADLDF